MDSNHKDETVNDESVQSDTEQVSTEEVTTEPTPETAEEKVEENVETPLNDGVPTVIPEDEVEPATTLDEEAEAEASEVEVTGVPEGTFKPEDAPEGEFLAVVNSTGLTKFVLPREQAIESAVKGGFSVRVATEEEIPKTA